jgi:hypothetical protein
MPLLSASKLLTVKLTSFRPPEWPTSPWGICCRAVAFSKSSSSRV